MKGRLASIPPDARSLNLFRFLLRESRPARFFIPLSPALSHQASQSRWLGHVHNVYCRGREAVFKPAAPDVGSGNRRPFPRATPWCPREGVDLYIKTSGFIGIVSRSISVSYFFRQVFRRLFRPATSSVVLVIYSGSTLNLYITTKTLIFAFDSRRSFD